MTNPTTPTSSSGIQNEIEFQINGDKVEGSSIDIVKSNNESHTTKVVNNIMENDTTRTQDELDKNDEIENFANNESTNLFNIQHKDAHELQGDENNHIVAKNNDLEDSRQNIDKYSIAVNNIVVDYEDSPLTDNETSPIPQSDRLQKKSTPKQSTKQSKVQSMYPNFQVRNSRTKKRKSNQLQVQKKSDLIKTTDQINYSDDVDSATQEQSQNSIDTQIKYRSLSHKLISEFTNSPLQEITILDLSNLSICWENFPEASQAVSLETLLLSKNHLTELRCATSIQSLWKLDLRYNKISSLEFLINPQSTWKVMGSLLLGWNQISDMREIFKFLAITPVIELQVIGNPFAYTMRSISSKSKSKSHTISLSPEEVSHLLVQLCPFIWVLDGNFISSEQRQNSFTYFQDLESKNRNRIKGDKDAKRIKAILSLRDELHGILMRKRVERKEFKPYGRRIQSFLDYYTQHIGLLSGYTTNQKINDGLILQYLSQFYVESYLLERSILLPDDILFDSTLPNGLDIPIRTRDSVLRRFEFGPPFHTVILYSLLERERSQFVQLLQSSLLFSIHFRVECEILHNIFKNNPQYQSLKSHMKSVILHEIAQLPPYATICLLHLLNSRLGLENIYIPSQFSLEEKYKLSAFLYKKVLSTSCYSDKEVMSNMSALFDFVANIPSETTHNTSSQHNSHSNFNRIAVNSARILPINNDKGKRSLVHIDRSPKYILEDPEHASAFYYSSVRIPKEMEVVFLQGRWTTVLETLQNGVVVLNLQNHQMEYFAVPARNMIWNPSGSRAGYWKVQFGGARAPNLGDTIAKKTNISIFASNDTWNSSFLVSSKELVEELKLRTLENWSELNENIPFRIFQIPEEFVMQPGKVGESDQNNRKIPNERVDNPIPEEKPLQKVSRSSTFMTEVFPNDPKSDDASILREEQSIRSDSRWEGNMSWHDTNSTFSQNFPSRTPNRSITPIQIRSNPSRSRVVSPIGQIREVTVQNPSAPQPRTPPHISSTSEHGSPTANMNMNGGMSFNLPNMLQDQSRNHQLQHTNPTPHIANKKQWRVVPGKSQFVVHNPLDLHPFTQKPEKKYRPIVTEPVSRFLKHDNLDKDISVYPIPEKPFRTRYHFHRHGTESLRQKKLRSLVPRPDTPGKSSHIEDSLKIEENSMDQITSVRDAKRGSTDTHERFNMYGKASRRSSSITHPRKSIDKNTHNHNMTKSRMSTFSALDPEDQQIFL